MAADGKGEGVNRAAITACVILTTLMQALDTTIANVARPYEAGLGEPDQIACADLDIVAAAIMTPPTGYLAGLS
jgi:DHA2 family multidrug resistance protein